MREKPERSGNIPVPGPVVIMVLPHMWHIAYTAIFLAFTRLIGSEELSNFDSAMLDLNGARGKYQRRTVRFA
jgi:hypothetical protein